MKPPGLDHGGCSSMKPRHGTEEAARAAAITASKRAGIDLSHYRCPECSGHHLTRSVGGDNPVVDGRRHRR